MRFNTDENMPVELIRVLTEHGHDALSVLDQRPGGRPDPNEASACQAE
ncbi:MAG: DUF5615 family PIN-like protein [Isosphaeraceae bacterium]